MRRGRVEGGHKGGGGEVIYIVASWGGGGGGLSNAVLLTDFAGTTVGSDVMS